eukprot:g4424.t1
MMGNQSMQQMMLGATRRSGSLEAALSLEQRDETWLVIISESGQGPEFWRKTTVFNVEGDDLGEILSSAMGDWRTQGDAGRTDDILAALVKACCYPAQLFGPESGATPTTSPMGHKPCRPARVLLDKELLTAAGAGVAGRLKAAEAAAPPRLQQVAHERLGEGDEAGPGFLQQLVPGLDENHFEDGMAAAAAAGDLPDEIGEDWAPGAVDLRTGIPPRWYARPADCPWVDCGGGKGEGAHKPRMMWGWRSALEEVVRAGDAERACPLLDDVIREHGLDALLDFAEGRDLLSKLVQAAFRCEGSDVCAKEQTLGDGGVPAAPVRNAGPCMETGMYARGRRHPVPGTKEQWQPWPLPARPDYDSVLRQLLARGVPADGGKWCANKPDLVAMREASGCHGEGALYHCAVLGKVGLAEQLILAGADPHRCGAPGLSPVFMTAVNGQLRMLELLVRLGRADVTRPNQRDGCTPLRFAEQMESCEKRGMAAGQLQEADCVYAGAGHYAEQVRAMIRVGKLKARGNAQLKRGDAAAAAASYERAVAADTRPDSGGHLLHLLYSNLSLLATKRADLVAAERYARLSVTHEPRWRKGLLRLQDVMQRVAKEGNADTQDDGDVQESARRLAREHADKTLEAWCSEGQLIKASMGLGDEVRVVWRVATGGGRGTPL